MDKPRLLKYSLIAAAFTFNNWLLGIFLNHRLFLAGGTVSEFSARTQPHAWLFRLLDIIAGILLMLSASLIYKSQSNHRYLKLAAIILGVLGLADCLDAVLPLPCSGTLDAVCSAPVRINFQRVSLPDHVFSSTLIGLCYILIPLALLHARRRIHDWIKVISIVSLASTLLFFTLLVMESLFEGTLIDHLAGYSEELQMLALGGLLIGMVWQVVSEESPHS